jgi:hypothetical protein
MLGQARARALAGGYQDALARNKLVDVVRLIMWKSAREESFTKESRGVVQHVLPSQASAPTTPPPADHPTVTVDDNDGPTAQGAGGGAEGERTRADSTARGAGGDVGGADGSSSVAAADDPVAELPEPADDMAGEEATPFPTASDDPA